jgi:CBS domain-containing protein
MRSGLLICSPDATLGQVATLLAQHRVHALVVAESPDQPLGIVSDLDVLAGEWLSADEQSLQAMRTMTARQLMSAPPAAIDAGQPIAAAVRRMREGRIHRLLVTEAERAVGVLSVSDWAAHLGTTPLGRRTVAEAMSRGLVICRPETPLAAAARAMTERRSRSLVVMEASGRMVGLITGYDLLSVGPAEAGQRTVASLMHAPLTIHPEASLREAADAMIQHQVHRLVVTDAAQPDALPLGLISTSDIVALMARPGSVWQGG